MRFKARLLLVCLCTFLIAVSATAQTQWLADMTAILTNNDQQVVIDDIRLIIEANNGTLVQHAPPGVLLGQLPDAAVTALAGHPNIRKISKTALNATAEGITDANARRAIDYFNWVVTGGVETALEPATDPTQPPTASSEAFLGSSTDIGSNSSPEMVGDHPKLGVPTVVNLVFVNGGGLPAFTDAQKAATAQELMLAMSWWNTRIQMHYGVARPVNGSFYTIREYTVTASAGDPSEFSDAPLWVNSAMGQACSQIGGCAGYDAGAATGSTDFRRYQYNVRQFNLATQQQLGRQDAFTVFVANKTIDEFENRAVGAYAISLGGAWWTIGPNGSTSDRAGTMAHETGHIYWACDEYSTSSLVQSRGCASCDSSRVALNGNADAPSNNTASCTLDARKHNNCLMKAISGFRLTDSDFDSEIEKLCWFSRQQIGWVSPSCWTDVNWNVTSAAGGTQWEGQYFVDARIPRMPVVHWGGAPELVRADSGITNGFSMNFGTTPLTSACMGASAGTPRTTNFSARWRRVVNLSNGDYIFSYSTGSTDDEVRVYVDGRELKPSTTSPGTFERFKLISSGDHTIQIDYYQGTGASPSVSVSWSAVTIQVCNTSYKAKLTTSTYDICNGPTTLEVTADGGVGPYRVTVQRNNDTPITYDLTDPSRTLTITPQTVWGTSRFTLLAVYDKNNCTGIIESDHREVTVNLDPNLPRIVPKVEVEPVGCAYRVRWSQASVCNPPGGSIVYQLERTTQLPSQQPVVTTVLSCAPATTTEYIDNTILPNALHIYRLRVYRIPAGETCPTAKAIEARSTPIVAIPGRSSCPSGTTALTTNAVTSAYGSLATLSARLTGNGAGLSGRTVTFELGANVVGTATTNTNGDATLVTTMTLPIGTHATGVVARYAGDTTWPVTKATNSVTVSTTCTPASITTQPVDKNILGGGSTSLSLAATGSATVSVKWYKANGTYVGATNPITVAPSDSTQYYAMVSNGCRTVQSNTVTVTVCNAPAITVQPTGGATLVAGGSRTLSVTATGTDTLFYRWYENGVAITGATARTLTVSPTTTTSYHVVVTNGCGSATSATATINVCSGTPVITTQPQSVTITSGQSTPLSVATSSAGVSYQWYQGTTLITGATSASYTVAPTVTTTYKVVLTNACGTVTSNTATVTVCKPPAISSNPTSRSINSGESTTLSATMTGTSLTYQWYLSNGTAISGATQSYVTVSPTVTTSYYMKATNTCGTKQTATATVTICAPPTISTQPKSVVITAGESTTLWVNANSNVSATYQWYDQNGAPISGATDNTFTVSPASTRSYYVIVSNSCGTVESNYATVTVYVCEPLQITQEPSDVTITAGQPATMTAHLYGSSPWSLQWYENGSPMSGRTAAGTTVYPTVTTTYYLIGTNPCGSVQTRTVTVTVN